MELSRLRALTPRPGGGVALRVQVNHEHPVAKLGQCRSKVDRRGRLADPALLVGDGQDSRQRWLLARERGQFVGRYQVLAGAPQVVEPAAARTEWLSSLAAPSICAAWADRMPSSNGGASGRCGFVITSFILSRNNSYSKHRT